MQLVDHTTHPVTLYEDGGGIPRAKFLITTVDQPNKNNRIYSRKLVEREIETFKAGTVLGQSEHPSENRPARLTDQFLVFEKLELVGNQEFGIAKIADTDAGRNFKALVAAGAQVSCSRRGYGELREGTYQGRKVMYVKEDGYTLQGVDVLHPGTQSDPHARLVSVFENVNVPQDVRLRVLTENITSLTEDVLFLGERVDALTYLIEKAKGERYPLLVIEELKNCQSVREIDAKWTDAVKYATWLVETGRGRLSRAGSDLTESERRQVDEADRRQLKYMADISGLRLNLD